MLSFLRRCWNGVFGDRSLSPIAARDARPRFHVTLFETRAAAMTAAQTALVVAVAASHGKRKWAYLLCPCGCGHQIALNLMSTHRPFWHVSETGEQYASIYPSIDSTTCGAHFWIRAGVVNWAE